MIYRLPRTEIFNNSNKIIFESVNFGEIVIDKTKKKIINNEVDITDKMDKLFCKNTLDYNLATVLYKILHNKIDEKCRDYLRKFDKVTVK